MNPEHYELEFYEEPNGDQPVRRWIVEDLPRNRRLALIAALEVILGRRGLAVCESEWGKALGDGLYEFRVRHSETEIRALQGQQPDASSEADDRVLLRVFFHAYGDKIVLLLAGYDKGADASPRRQQREIALARKRLRAFKEAQRRSGAAGNTTPSPEGETRTPPGRSFLAWRRSQRKDRGRRP